ncbi:MAG: hypothetical protein FJX75_04335 [Armatimonadetes bacterium]|nr:hypothetical protein [Armatimonadota bacterium]
MKSISPVWVAVAIVVILIGAAIVVTAWRAKLANPGGNPGAKTAFQPSRPLGQHTEGGRRVFGNVEVQGPSLVQRDAQGNEVWSAQTTGAVEVSDKDERVRASGVVWKLTRGKDTVAVVSQRMELTWRGGDVEFGGDIDIRASGDRRFTAKRARFETGTDKLICEGGVAWNAGRYSAGADKLVIDVRNKKIRLRGNVKLVART